MRCDTTCTEWYKSGRHRQSINGPSRNAETLTRHSRCQVVEELMRCHSSAYQGVDRATSISVSACFVALPRRPAAWGPIWGQARASASDGTRPLQSSNDDDSNSAACIDLPSWVQHTDPAVEFQSNVDPGVEGCIDPAEWIACTKKTWDENTPYGVGSLKVLLRHSPALSTREL